MDCNTTEAIRILAQLAEACGDDDNYAGQSIVLSIIDKIVGIEVKRNADNKQS